MKRLLFWIVGRSRGAARSSCLVVTTLLLPTLAVAQDRATEFVAVSGPAHESVPGGTLLVSAYAFVWLVVLGIVLRIVMVQGKAAKDLARLEKTIAERAKTEAAAEKSA